MSDDGNMITLRPRGGGGPPGLPPLPGDPPAMPPAPPTVPPPAAPHPSDEGSGADPSSGRDRRSAADSLTALTPAGLAMPPVPGVVPATFRSDAPDDRPQGPGLGALSLSALLAVALAALRGTAGAVQDWRQRRMEREAEAEPLRKARLKLAEARAGTDASMASTGGGRGRVLSSQEWGSRAHRGGRGSGGTGGGGLFGRGSSGGNGKTSGSRPGTSSGSPSTGRSGGTTGKTGTGSSAPGKGGRTGSSSGSAAGSGKPGKAGGSSSGSGSSGGGKSSPGTLGQLAMERAKRRTARDAAADKRAGRQQKADLAAGATGKAGKGSGDGGTGKVSLVKDKGKGKTGRERVTLGKAAGDETYRLASDRLRKRREDPAAPFLSRSRKRDTDGEESPADGSEDGKDAPETAAEGSGATEGASGPETAAHGPDGAKPGADAGDASTGGGWDFWTPPPRGERRGAEDAMRDATDEGVTVTVEWPDRPTGPARHRTPAGAVGVGVRGLPRAPHRPAGPRPGTTAPTKGTATVSTPAVRLPGHVPGVAAEHMTDVTLDDVLDHLAESRDRCFHTYDECARLAGKALSLREALDELAEELRARHNIIGRLTAAAMALLADSMDLLARKAVEMRTESLKAAEAVELAHDEMHDAYRPVQQATADAGLHMPSARIHNED